MSICLVPRLVRPACLHCSMHCLLGIVGTGNATVNALESGFTPVASAGVRAMFDVGGPAVGGPPGRPGVMCVPVLYLIQYFIIFDF